MSLTRRHFIQQSAASAAAVTLASYNPLRAAYAPSEKLVVAVMGVNGRGNSLAQRFAGLPGCELKYICDVDSRVFPKAQKAIAGVTDKPPQELGDFRKALDDKDVDALVIAAPDHWHAPATMLACSAGKHVYVEKPCSHNPQEGEWMVESARKHKRVVQMGAQRRSMPGIIEAIEKLKAGEIGKVLQARAWYFNPRPAIGKGQQVPVPEGLDYSLWQGPAPEKPYRDNLVHYHWHWYWHWGTAELGNNGVHLLDLCRWGLGVEYPQQVTCTGGRYRYDDDQQTPDACIASFEFGGKSITWESRSWARKFSLDVSYDCAFFGENGVLAITGNGYKILDPKGNEIATGKGEGSDQPHTQNFVDAIRADDRSKLNLEILDGHRTTLLCHLGNISYRTGRILRTDNTNGHIIGDKEASAHWSREYRPGWEPKV